MSDADTEHATDDELVIDGHAIHEGNVLSPKSQKGPNAAKYEVVSVERRWSLAADEDEPLVAEVQRFAPRGALNTEDIFPKRRADWEYVADSREEVEG